MLFWVILISVPKEVAISGAFWDLPHDWVYHQRVLLTHCTILPSNEFYFDFPISYCWTLFLFIVSNLSVHSQLTVSFYRLIAFVSLLDIDTQLSLYIFILYDLLIILLLLMKELEFYPLSQLNYLLFSSGMISLHLIIFR